MFFSYRLFVYLFVSLCIEGFSLHSFAGSRDDRQVLWVNLDDSQDGFAVDTAIRELINSRRVKEQCGGDWSDAGSTLYMKKRPEGVTNDLVRKAFIEKDKASLQDLSKFLKSFRDPARRIDEGLDGIIVYAKTTDMKLMNFVTGRKKIKTINLGPSKSPPSTPDIENGFCALLPPVTRSP